MSGFDLNCEKSIFVDTGRDNQIHNDMKKLSIIAIAALALAAAACTQEKSIDQAAPEGLTTITASREVSTRSSLQATVTIDGPVYGIFWDAPDKILVGYAGSSLAEFTSKNEEPAAEATFVGKLPEGSGTLYGIYPASSDHSVDADGVFSIAFKDVQTAVAGSYDPEAFPAVAQSDSKELSFLNVCGLLALQVGYDDVTKISLSGEVAYPYTTRSAAMEPIPGGILTGEISSGGLELTSYSEDLYEIVLNAPDGGFFSKEETYYMAVPPCTLPYGVTFTLSRESGAPVDIIIEGSLAVERSKVHKVKTLYIAPANPVTDVTLLQPDLVISVGDSYEIEYELIPADGSFQGIYWSTSDGSVVDVSGGIAYGLGTGNATITMTVKVDDETSIVRTIDLRVV